ncbi:MAG: sulfate permease [Bacteroidota bacterium]
MRINWSQFVPLVGQLKGYAPKTFRQDILAGLTVCIMLIPQGMAYALLAGMPPIYGLYGGLIPLLLYGIFGTSRQLSVGPVAVSALLVLAGISQVAEPGSNPYIALVILTGLLVGLGQLLLSMLRLGFLANFLSHPVIMGFTSAAAIIIAASQLKYLLGIDIPRFEQTYQTILYALQHALEIHWLSFTFCLGGMVIMLAIKRRLPYLPAALIVSVISIILCAVLRLDQAGLAIVGNVPQGLPDFIIPTITWATIYKVLPTVLTVTIIGIVEALSIAKALELKNKDVKIRPNQELLALGLGKVLGSFFQAIPTSASFTRSAVNNEAGARTGVASIVAALATGLALIFFTPLFYYLPEATLAAIVLMAVRGLFEIKGAIELWKVHRIDFAMLVTTFVVTLALGIEEGVLTGVILSLLMIIFQASQPRVVTLGRLPDSRSYRDVERFPDAVQFPGVLILRFDGPLFFLNAEYFKSAVIRAVHEQGSLPELFILDASSILDIDSGGLEALAEINSYLSSKNITFYLTGILGPVRDRMHQAGLAEAIGRKHQFLFINDALLEFLPEYTGDSTWSESALQHNLRKRSSR